MNKDFASWHPLKAQLNERHVPTFQEREIWWCSIGLNVGSEADGKHEAFHRPVLIVRKFNRQLFFGVPLSTQAKTIPYYHVLTFKKQERYAVLMQARAWSARRLQRHMGQLPEDEFDKVRRALRAML